MLLPLSPVHTCAPITLDRPPCGHHALQALEHYRTAAALRPSALVHRVEVGRTLLKVGGVGGCWGWGEGLLGETPGEPQLQG